MNGTDALTAIPAQATRAKPRVISRTLIAKSVVSNWSYLAVNILVAFWMAPFVVRHLGDASYGLWALVLQLTGYMGVVDVGLRSALIRFVSRFKAQGDQEAFHQLLNSTFTLYALMVPACFLFASIVAVFVLPHMHIPGAMIGAGRITVFIAAGCVACDFLFATSHASLAGMSRWDLTNAVWITVLLVRTTLIVILLKLGFGLIALALVQFGVTAAGYSAETLILFRLIPEFRFKWQAPRWAHMRPVMQHGWYAFLLSIAVKINYQLDTIVIALFLPIEQVTLYVVGFRLIEYLRELVNSSTMIIAPLVSSLDAVGETPHVAAMLVRGTKYSLMIAFTGAMAFWGLGTEFIRLWMGERFAGPSGTVLAILTIGTIVSASEFVGSHTLFGLSKHRLSVFWTFMESILNLTFSIALVRHYGIFGVAAGTAIANLIVRGWFFPNSVLKTLGVPWQLYLRKGVLPAVLSPVIFLVGILLFKRLFVISGYGSLGLAGVSGFVFFLLPCLWYFGLDTEERSMILAKLPIKRTETGY